MKRVIKKIVAGIVVVTVVFVSGLITIALSPQMVFANKLEHSKFTIYSDEPYDEVNLKTRLDEAYKLIEYSELHDPNYRFGVLLAHNHFWNKIEDLRGKGVIARPLAKNITIKVPIDPKLNQATTPRSKVNLTWLLAHEIVHVLQANKYGITNFGLITQPPMWKLEGYPEYISRREKLKDKDYDLRLEIDRYLQLKKESVDGWLEVVENHHIPFYYYKGRLMTEYLMDIQGITYDEILKSSRIEEEIFNEMLEWRYNN